MIVPRYYQEEAIRIGIDHLLKGTEAAMEVLPTGSGKSVVIAGIAKALPGRTIIFQPSKEILEQNFKKLTDYEPFIDAGIYSASMNRKQVRNITFATIGSVINMKKLFSQYEYVIIDECHLVNPKQGMYKGFLDNLQSKAILGLTATPYRLHSNSYGSELRFLTRTQPKVFKKMIYYVQIKELMDAGHLSPMKYRAIDGFDTTKIKRNSTGSDYDDHSLQTYYNEIGFEDSLLDVTQRLVDAGRKNILVFTKFTAESQRLVDELGSGAALVTADTKKAERERILEGFKSGDIRIVSNVGVLTTGFDYPELETVLIARPTMSMALYYQMVGRGMRPHKDKPECWVVDMCENFKLFGRVENFEIQADGKKDDLWFIRNRETGKQLTNVSFNR